MSKKSEKISRTLLERLNDNSKKVIVASVILAGVALTAGYSLNSIYSSIPPLDLNCRVEGVEGSAPFTVKVVTSFNGPSKSFNYEMGEESQGLFRDKPGIFFYTYSKPGFYEVKVSNSSYNNGQMISCKNTEVKQVTGSEVNPE